MRSLIIVGCILLAISGFMFYYTTDFNPQKMELSHFMGMMGGIGTGLILGGIIGYASKAKAIREARRRAEIRALEEEKRALEQKNAELAAAKAAKQPGDKSVIMEIEPPKKKSFWEL